MNLSDLMTTSAARHGERTAIRQGDVALSYTALERASALVAGLLKEHGVRPGDRVGVMLPNVAYFPIAGTVWFLGAIGQLPRVKRSTQGEGHERRYFYGSVWAVATEVHLVNRLANQVAPDRLVVTLDPFGCLCSTMFRVSPNHLLWILEGLVEGQVHNQIIVPDETKRWAKLALDRMLQIQ